jgi:hypothetical protein
MSWAYVKVENYFGSIKLFNLFLEIKLSEVFVRSD